MTKLALSLAVARRMKLAGEAAAVDFAMGFDDHGTTHFPFIPAMIKAGMRGGIARDLAEAFARRLHERSRGVCAAGGFPLAGGTLDRVKARLAAELDWSLADASGRDPVRSAARRRRARILAATSERGLEAAFRGFP